MDWDGVLLIVLHVVLVAGIWFVAPPMGWWPDITEPGQGGYQRIVRWLRRR